MVMIKLSEQGIVEPRRGSVACISTAGLHRMAYQEWGDPQNTDVVICVHGLTRVGEDFQDLAQALSDRFRVVCPDVVGRGRSSWLKNPMLYGVPQYTADMVTLIARLNVDRVKWVGTSMGGLIGMSLAALAQSPVERLVLNDVGAVLSGAALGRIAAYVGVKTEFDSYAQASAFLRMVFASFGPHSEAQWRQLIDSVVVVQPDGRTRLHYDPAIAEPFRQAYGAQAAAGQPPGDLSMWPLYDLVRCPTLLLRGAESDLLTRDVAQEMAARGPKPSVIEFAGIGHAPSLMHADQITVIRDFLLQTDAHER